MYANQRVQGAVVAVPTTAFAQSQPVARVAMRVSPETIVKVPVAHVASVAPVQASVTGAAAPGHKPPAQDAARPVVVRNAPPAPPPAFAAQQQQLAAKPGVPLDTNSRAALKPATPAAAPPAHVVVAKQAPAPTAVPPPAPAGRVAQPADKGQQDKGPPPEKGNATANANQRNEPPATVARPPINAGAPQTPSVANAKQEQRTERMTSPLGSAQDNARPPANTPPETRGLPESRTQSAMARPQNVPRPPTATQPETRTSPESRTQSAMAPQQTVPRPPTVTPPETRGQPETRGPPETRGAPESRTQSANARPQNVPRPPETRGPPPESRTQSAMAPQSVARPPATAQRRVNSRLRHAQLRKRRMLRNRRRLRHRRPTRLRSGRLTHVATRRRHLNHRPQRNARAPPKGNPRTTSAKAETRKSSPSRRNATPSAASP